MVRVCLMLMLVGLPVLPQPKLRTVSGIVTDKAGNALPKAVVQIEDTHSQAVSSYITANDGRYHFADLSADTDYTLKAHYRELWSRPHTLSKFETAKHLKLDLVIPID